MSRFIVPVVVFLIFVPILMVGLTRDPSELPSPFIGKPAPFWDLPSLTRAEQRVGTESFAGQAALINIWATWCVGCRQEHAFLMELAASASVPIYGINWRDNRRDALVWLQQYGDPYIDSGFDQDARVGIDWGAYGAPETFLVSAEGIVLHKHLGPLTPAIWAQDFEPLLAKAEDQQ